MPSPHIFGLLENKQLAKKETFTSAKDLILERRLCIEGHVPAPAQLPRSTYAPHMYICHPSHSTPQAPHPTHATTQALLPPFPLTFIVSFLGH